ncbi:MAG: hypothetical protein FJ405_19605 [Verrucomicrobia bacterium]|nr:hypothetical protein [Verrucomicrobiota bacterium]
MINRQALAAGEQVDGYTVTSIEPDKVTLSGYGEGTVHPEGAIPQAEKMERVSRLDNPIRSVSGRNSMNK